MQTIQETSVHEEPKALPLPILLDATVRTLDAWAAAKPAVVRSRLDVIAGRFQNIQLRWHPPIFPSFLAHNADPEKDSNASLPDQVKAVLDHNRAAQPAWADLTLHLPSDQAGVEAEIERKIEDPTLRRIAWLVLVGVLTPPLVQTLMTIRKYRQVEGLPELKQELEQIRALGEQLLRRPMSREARWRVERVLSAWIDELSYADRWRTRAEQTLSEMKDEPMEMDTRTWTDLVFPEAGSPGLFGELAVMLYEGIYGVTADKNKKLPPFARRRSLHGPTLHQTAEILSVVYPDEDLGSGWRDKLRRSLVKRFHSPSNSTSN